MSKKSRDPIAPFLHMEEPNFTDEEIKRIFREMETYDPEELPEKDLPVWLFAFEALHRIKDHEESVSGRYVSAKMDEVLSDLVSALVTARRAFHEESVGPISEILIREYVELLVNRWFVAIGMTNAVRYSPKNRVKTTGHAAYPPEKSWITYWDNRWLERRPNGKGWLYSADRILKELPADVVPPSHTTISRYRKKVFQSD